MRKFLSSCGIAASIADTAEQQWRLKFSSSVYTTDSNSEVTLMLLTGGDDQKQLSGVVIFEFTGNQMQEMVQKCQSSDVH